MPAKDTEKHERLGTLGSGAFWIHNRRVNKLFEIVQVLIVA